MSKRPPAAPPQLPGFEYVQLLGSGGFADVFLYEQQMPRRRVAVKVLLEDRLESSGQQFAAEANVMAMLSTHPAIVTIYQAGMSDDGRPYIVMEYCPRPNLQVRYRREPFSVAETLHTAIPVAAAVETAHRADVLHRDIKPANILVTEYNRPALTDFGIASNPGASEEAAGMSIPWSPPESFLDPPRTGRPTDVYQLGATIYTLLAGRSPFEVPGQRNGSVELIDRAERMPLPRIARPDVPASLQDVLARAMAKSPDARYPSAVAFARALQKVQIELGHAVTPIDILDDSPAEELDDDDDGLTRVRNVMNIAPGAETGTRPSATTQKVDGRAAVDDETVLRGPAGADDTVLQPAVFPDFAFDPSAPAPAAQPGHAPAPHAVAQRPGQSDPWGQGATAPAGAPAATSAHAKKGPVWPWFVGAGAVLAVLVLFAVFALSALMGDDAADPEPPPTAKPVNPITGTPPAVTELSGAIEGDEATFTWVNPDPEDGDRYQWALDVAGEQPTFDNTTDEWVAVPAAGDRVCIIVHLVRSNSLASAPATACTE